MIYDGVDERWIRLVQLTGQWSPDISMVETMQILALGKCIAVGLFINKIISPKLFVNFNILLDSCRTAYKHTYITHNNQTFSK